MRIAFRVDASVQMGTGHLKRCLSLAEAYSEAGASILFVTRRIDVASAAVIAGAGFEVKELAAACRPFQEARGLPSHASWATVAWPSDADETIEALRSYSPDLVVVDHYAFDAAWHERAKTALRSRLVAIDDLGDRALAADFIVDPTLSPDFRAKHHLSASHKPVVLGGSRFALLSSVYRTRRSFEVRPRVKSIGIFMGGSDVSNFTQIAWRAARLACGAGIRIEVASTSANPHLGALQEEAAKDENSNLTVDAADLVEFFGRHDLQIGAGGGATWERCCLGVPTLLLAFAENQLSVARPLHEIGAVHFVGAEATDPAALAAHVTQLAEDYERRRAMSEASRRLVDGWGTQRIAAATLPRVELRPADEGDHLWTWAWRNDPGTRAFFRNPDPIEEEEHRTWWKETVRSPGHHLFIAQAGRLPVAVLRFDDRGPESEVSIYVAPHLTGLRVGKKVLEAGIARARQRPSIERLIAWILPQNTPSQALFGAAGFKQDGELWTLQNTPALEVEVLCSDPAHPVFSFLKHWQESASAGRQVRILNKAADVSSGDFLFLIACQEIVKASIRERFRHCLVVHESDLPQGRGWSPLAWQILEGKSRISATLLDAEDKVDSGKIWKQLFVDFDGTELAPEINARMSEATLELMDWALENCDSSQPREQTGEPSYYPKRTPADSEVSAQATLEQVFDQLRIADENRYPAFVRMRGKRYRIRLDPLQGEVP